MYRYSGEEPHEAFQKVVFAVASEAMSQIKHMRTIPDVPKAAHPVLLHSVCPLRLCGPGPWRASLHNSAPAGEGGGVAPARLGSPPQRTLSATLSKFDCRFGCRNG